MIQTILEHLPYLFLAISMNIVLGMYYNIGAFKQKFNFPKLIKGIGKAFVISYGFISSALLYDKMFDIIELGGVELQPDLLIKSAILMYLGKGLMNLKEILQVAEVYIPEEEYVYEEKEEIEEPQEIKDIREELENARSELEEILKQGDPNEDLEVIEFEV